MAEADASPADALHVRAMERTGHDVDLFNACFARNSAVRSNELLEWQYLRNPTGQIFVDLAVAGERLAAIYATLPVRIRIGDQVVLGLQSVDTITDADFRGRGLFLSLAKSTYARAHAAGATLVYGFPNGSSAHGFFKRLDWTDLDPVPFLIRPLRTAYVLERLKLQRYGGWLGNMPLHFKRRRSPPDGRLELITRFDERATALWQRFAPRVGLAVERDASYLNWRLVEKPGESYTTLGIFHGDELGAFVSYVVKAKHGGRIGYVMEALCAEGRERDLRLLFGRVLDEMIDQAADVALAWCFSHSPTFRSYLRAGFVPFPTKLRPIELHFGARNFSADAAVAQSRNNWYLSYVDADTT